MAHDPVVFISSTAEDLKEHRIKAADAARASQCSLRWMEDLASGGDKLTLPACKQMVEQAEVVVVLVAHRYGWVPDGLENPDSKSITWLECDHARQAGKEVLAFVVDPDLSWPPELKEDYRLTKEKNQPARKFNQIRKEVLRNERKLAEFKQELSLYPRRPFTDAASVYTLVFQALTEWRHQRYPAQETAPPGDPELYLKALEDDTRQIRIKHLKTRRAEPYFFGIDKIYIPLTTAGPGAPRKAARKGAVEEMVRERRVVLEQELSNPKVVVVGHAGSGKSTFLRRVAFELCRNLRGTRPADAPPFLAQPFLSPNDKRFPILIRIADFAVLLDAETKSSGLSRESEEWIPRYLGRRHGGDALFRRKLQQEACLVMLDGLDEAPNIRMRTRIARLFENAAKKYSKCHWLVSTRPRSYEGDTVLEGFQEIRIDDLQRPQIDIFLDQFAQALDLNQNELKAFKDGLEKAFDGRTEIREMGRNPLMLTALAILQHGGGKLPEYRYELYESILGWLAQAREDKEGRLPDKQCLQYLRRLALAMQNAENGRLRQMNRRKAAEFLAHEFGGTAEENDDLLEQETHDSGIISSVGRDLEFWHLSLQEYLAAKEISGLTDKDLVAKVVTSKKLYDPEWREMMRLLGGVLCDSGEPRIEALFQAILGELGDRPTLADQVRCGALLSAMMQDLSPMNYKPKTEAYERTVKAVMGIFETGEAEKIEIARRIEAAELLGQVGDPRLDEDNWVTIPAGSFTWGRRIRKAGTTIRRRETTSGQCMK
jgi:hypothetical protein